MKSRNFLVLLIALAMSSCTTILVETTGNEGIQEDPTERTTGAMVEDEAIETKVLVNMKSQEPGLKNAHIDAISYNGVVLLVGQVESEALKSRATQIASQASAKIKRIHNEMEVSGKTSLLSRTNDTWIATKVRTRMMANRDVPSDQIKIVAENGTVYLMGLISEMEGDNAANVARNVSGVSRVVKVFEYIN
jgi:osmotically-inducible protein OsmY